MAAQLSRGDVVGDVYWVGWGVVLLAFLLKHNAKRTLCICSFFFVCFSFLIFFWYLFYFAVVKSVCMGRVGSNNMSWK